MSAFKDMMGDRVPDLVVIEMENDDETIIITGDQLDAGFDVRPDDHWVFVTLANGDQGVAYPAPRVRAIRITFAPVQTWAGRITDTVTIRRPEADEGRSGYCNDERCGRSGLHPEHS